MHLARDSGGRSELLIAIHPAFVDALPVASWSSSVQESNYITLLRHEITNMMQVFNAERAEQYLAEETFCVCTESLDSILIHFEGLVAEGILAGSYNSNDEMLAEFPKLAALKWQISTGELRSASRWISFGKKPAQHNTTLIAQSFNKTISKLFSTMNNESSMLNVPEHDEKYESDKVTLRKAEELSVALGAMFEQLKKTICLKDPEGHNSYVRLSEFAKNELQMMISICGNKHLWQQVDLNMGHLNNYNGRDAWIKEICLELTRSYRIKRVLSVDFDGKGLYKGSASKAHSKESTLSTETLSDILQKEEQLRQSKVSHYRTIKKKDKRRLGLLLSNCLVHYSGSALLQTPWNANTIHIRQQKDGIVSPDTAPEAYMIYAFDPPPTKKKVSDEDSEPGDPFVLALAKLLIELELEKEITVLDEDIDDITGKRSLYMAITRIHGDLDEYLEGMDPFPGIIDSCLQICTDLYDTGPCNTDGKGYHHKLRKEIFTKVVGPLSQRDNIISKSWKSIQRSRTAIPRSPPSYARRSPSPVPLIEAYRQPSVCITEITKDEDPATIQPMKDTLFSYMTTSGPLCLSSRGSISSSGQWLKELDFINQNLKSLRSVFRDSPKNRNVRVAILDTGCDMSAPCIASLRGAAARLAGHWQDFQEVSTEPIDEDSKQHGTALTAILLRVAFNVDIYVGRVAKDQAGLPNSTQNISKGIHYAATEWKADIITMSFGFPDIVREIEDAVADVNRRRRNEGKSEVVFFAAANNDGLNSEELFPASLETVISVRGTDHTGAFVNQFSPIPRPQKARSLLYGTLGQNVPYDMGDKNAQISGCSVATPILAGIVATIVQYANYTVGMDAETGTRLLTKDGVLQVLEHISVGQNSGFRRYIAPWLFFKGKEAERLATIIHALSKLERYVKLEQHVY